MHLKPAGTYTGAETHPGRAPGAHVPVGQARRSHSPSSLSRNSRPPAHLPTRQSWQRHRQHPSAAALSRLTAAREHAPSFNPPWATRGRHRFWGPSPAHPPTTSAGSAFTIKIHLEKPGLELKRHKLSSDLGLW